MNKPTVLLIESDTALQNQLKTILDKWFQVITCATGAEAKAEIARMLPHTIVLSCDLLDADGYELLREWRTTTRTSHVPVLLTQRDATREHKIKGLELGADDFVLKPIEEEDFLMRVRNTLPATRRPKPRLNPVTGFGIGSDIEAHIRELRFLERRDWIYVDTKILHFESFNEVYGWQKADELQQEIAEQLRVIVKQFGTVDDYIGQPSRDYFVVITHSETYEQLIDELAEKINELLPHYYSQEDRERGYTVWEGKQFPLMTLTWGTCDVRKTRPQDTRELVLLAQEDRLKKDPNYVPDIPDEPDNDILTAW